MSRFGAAANSWTRRSGVGGKSVQLVVRRPAGHNRRRSRATASHRISDHAVTIRGRWTFDSVGGDRLHVVKDALLAEQRPARRFGGGGGAQVGITRQSSGAGTRLPAHRFQHHRQLVAPHRLDFEGRGGGDGVAQHQSPPAAVGGARRRRPRLAHAYAAQENADSIDPAQPQHPSSGGHHFRADK